MKRFNRWPILLLRLLAACGSPLPKQRGMCPYFPSMPYVRAPVNTGVYVQSAKDDAQKWKEKLGASTPRSEPLSKRGLPQC
jgi:hypothetical protein